MLKPNPDDSGLEKAAKVSGGCALFSLGLGCLIPLALLAVLIVAAIIAAIIDAI